MSWYVVTCRIAFDSEDSLYIVNAESWQDATAEVERQMREERELAPADDDNEERTDTFYVNHVVRCDGPRPVIELEHV